jgi:transposase
MSGRVVKRAYRYRFYPSEQQERELLRTFGCVRKVYNLALEARTKAWYAEQRRVSYVQTSAMLTAWKRDPGLAYLCEVSSVPLQQGLRHLQGAFAAFWDRRAKYPRFKSPQAGPAVRRVHPLGVPLPRRPADFGEDGRAAGHPLVPALARWYGRDLVVVDRWFPSSKVCSACGALRDGLPLSVREWSCPCGRITTATSTRPAPSEPPGWRCSPVETVSDPRAQAHAGSRR